jgi:hypothetical protein
MSLRNAYIIIIFSISLLTSLDIHASDDLNHFANDLCLELKKSKMRKEQSSLESNHIEKFILKIEGFYRNTEEKPLKKEEFKARVVAAKCIKSYFDNAMIILSKLDPSNVSDVEKLNRHIRNIQWLYQVTAGGVVAYIQSLDLETKTSREILETIKLVDMKLSPFDISSAILSGVSIEHLKEFTHVVDTKVKATNYVEVIDSFLRESENLTKEQQVFYAGIIGEVLLRNAVFFEPQGIRALRREAISTLKYMEDNKGSFKEEIGRTKSEISQYSDLLKSNHNITMQVFDYFYKILEEIGLNHNDIKKLTDSLKGRKTVKWKSFELAEGDMFLNIDSGGWGDLFHTLAGVTNIFTHSGVLVRGESNGYNYYYFADILNELNITKVNSLSSSSIFVKPVFQTVAGFTTKSMSNLSNKEIRFDSTFTYGMIAEDGNYLLYCSEFIHFLYKNNFSEGTQLMLSPFDRISSKLSTTNKISLSNFKKMGMKTNQTFFVPDHILFSPDTVFRSSQIEAGAGGYSSEGHPSRVRLNKKIANLFNEHLSVRFKTAKFKNVGFFEKLKIDAFILANSYMNWINTPDVSFDDPESKYIFARYIKIQQELIEFTYKLEDGKNFNDQMSQSEVNRKMTHFRNNILPLIDSLFDL